MKTKIILGAIALLISTGFSSAQVDGRGYDRNIEQAAIRIAAAKMGDIRGGFDLNAAPVFVKPINRAAPTYLGAERKVAVSETTASIAGF